MVHAQVGKVAIVAAGAFFRPGTLVPSFEIKILLRHVTVHVTGR